MSQVGGKKKKSREERIDWESRGEEGRDAGKGHEEIPRDQESAKHVLGVLRMLSQVQ